MSHANPIEIVARFRNSTVHAWADHELIGSSGNEVFVVRDLARPVREVVARIPWRIWDRVSKVRWIERVLKLSILQVHKTAHGFLACTGHSWWHVQGDDAAPVVGLASTRPMSRGICSARSGTVYVAEYSLNGARRPVRIFRSSDALRFESAWEFAAGSVRHVHALIRDPEASNRLWVLTGDRDPECGVWFTDDEFATLRCFSQAGQTSRATDLVIRGGELFWGMDSPDERPFVVRARLATPGQHEKLFELPGPAYYMTQNEAGGIYVGTTAEPGRAVRDRRAHAFRFLPDGHSAEVFRSERDWFPQHGILAFPRGVLPGNALVFAQRALRPHEGCLTIARDRFFG